MLRRVSRRSAQTAAVATVAAITGGLLLRLAILDRLKPAVNPAAASPSSASVTPISPAWKLAFERDENGVPAIYVANGDGSDPRRILPDAEQPTWSPDRTRLAFVRRGNVYTAGPDGGGVRQITFWPDTRRGSGDWQPRVRGLAWDARDKVLTFARDEEFRLRLPAGAGESSLIGTTLFHAALDPAAGRQGGARLSFTIPAGQTPANWRETGQSGPVAPRFDATDDRTPFTFADNAYPAWSPAGDKLLFARNGDVWLAERMTDAGGRMLGWGVNRVLANAEYDGWTGGASHWTVAATGISWAPDASYFAFANERVSGSGQDDLHIVRPRIAEGKDEGEDDKTVYEDVVIGEGRSPSVSPDGKWIAYANAGQVEAVTPDGKNRRVLLTNAYHPAW